MQRFSVSGITPETMKMHEHRVNGYTSLNGHLILDNQCGDLDVIETCDGRRSAQ